MKPGKILFAVTVLGAGCSSPAEPKAAAPAGGAAAEQARREERQKIMQQFWYEHTAAPAEPGAKFGPGAGAARPSLDYPAGTYGGLRFGPRRAPDPSLTEPDR